MLTYSEIDSTFVSKRILKLGATRSIGKRENIHGKLAMVIATSLAAMIQADRVGTVPCIAVARSSAVFYAELLWNEWVMRGVWSVCTGQAKIKLSLSLAVFKQPGSDPGSFSFVNYECITNMRWKLRNGRNEACSDRENHGPLIVELESVAIGMNHIWGLWLHPFSLCIQVHCWEYRLGICLGSQPLSLTRH